ncbi:MAG: mechanosensitive ion channel [Chroococcidiopsidaceae cyanobacterium CP_BM_RX_35]|nr:mechanosensitive ion channel [Chroococcidiopsidaceae cyanobacterium CP_BM_RX_35]
MMIPWELVHSLTLPTLTLAQANQPQPVGLPGGGFLTGLGFNVGPTVLNLIVAIVLLIVGWIVAAIAAGVTRGILNRTNVDNRIAGWITGRSGQAASTLPVEKWVSSIVFWIIIIFTVVAFLDKLQLAAVSQPLNSFLQQVIGFLPKLAGAAILVGIAWILANLSKLVVTRALHAFGLDERLNQQVGSTTPGERLTSTPGERLSNTPRERPFLLSETIGNALYWFIFLLFLPAVLNTLGLQGTLQPVQQLLNEILSIVPNILAAVLIGAAGWLIAQVVRRIVTNLLAATGTDRIGTRFGLGRTTRGQSLSWIIGTIVYVLILIPTAIAALQALRIDAISQPAIAMLNQILSVLPKIFTAGVILILAYVLGHFLAELVTSILSSIGFDNIFNWLGLSALPRRGRRDVTPPRPTTAPSTATFPPPPPPPGETVIPSEQVTQLQTTPSLPTRTPSELIGIVVLVGIMLFATLAAVNILNIPALTALVGGLVVVSGRILAGLVVFAIGLYLANLAFTLITSSGERQALILGQIARIAIIAFVSAMALQQMGIASDIINLAFGLLLGAIAVSFAIAFGLGGRELAAQQVRELLDSFKQQRERPPY